MKAIFVRDVQCGDIIRFDDRGTVTVRGTLPAQQGPEGFVKVHVFGEDGSQHVISPGAIVGLVHRPLPEGRTLQHVWWDILNGAQAIVGGQPSEALAKHCSALREALEENDLARGPEPPTTVDGEVGPGYPLDATPLG